MTHLQSVGWHPHLSVAACDSWLNSLILSTPSLVVSMPVRFTTRFHNRMASINQWLKSLRCLRTNAYENISTFLLTLHCTFLLLFWDQANILYIYYTCLNKNCHLRQFLVTLLQLSQKLYVFIVSALLWSASLWLMKAFKQRLSVTNFQYGNWHSRG